MMHFRKFMVCQSTWCLLAIFDTSTVLSARATEAERSSPTVLIAESAGDPLLAANLRQVGELVRSGKIAEARQLAERTRALYPEDTQVKATLERLSVLTAATTPPEVATPAKVTPAVTPAPGVLSPEDRLELNAIRLLTARAKSANDPRERIQAWQQILERSHPLAARRLEELALWVARGQAALGLDRPREGWEAGKNLRALGALNRAEEEIASLMAELHLKGWLVADYASIEKAQQAAKQKEFEAAQTAWLGTWQASASKDYNYQKDGYRNVYTYTGQTSRKMTLAINSFSPPKVELTEEGEINSRSVNSRGARSASISKYVERLPGVGTMEESGYDYDGSRISEKLPGDSYSLEKVEVRQGGKVLFLRFLRKPTYGQSGTVDRLFYMVSPQEILGADADIQDREYSAEEIERIKARSSVVQERNDAPPRLLIHSFGKK